MALSRKNNSLRRLPLPFVGGWDVGRSEAVNCRRLLNMYPRAEDKASRATAVLYPTPGLNKIGNPTTTAACRGNGAVWKGNAYFVSGDKFLRIDKNDVFTEIGTLSTSSGNVSIAAGVSSLMVTDGTDGYSYDGTTFAVIASADFPPNVQWCAWVDNYFIVVEGGTGRWYISGLNDPTAWDPTDVATAERRADNAIRPVELRADVLIVGETTVELYFNSGNVDFPWENYPNTIFDFGTPAGASVATLDNIAFMVAERREGGFHIMKIDSQKASKISTPDIDWFLANAASVADAEGWTYEANGHSFYVVTFPAEGKTFCYDNTTALWHERGHLTKGRHLASGHVYFNGRHLIGAFDHNDYYELSETAFFDDTTKIQRLVRAPYIEAGRKNLSHVRVELLFEMGVGDTTGTFADPSVNFRWSDDFCRSWSTQQPTPLGAIGEYNTRAQWHSLGTSRARVYEWATTDAVLITFLGAFIDVRQGLE